MRATRKSERPTGGRCPTAKRPGTAGESCHADMKARRRAAAQTAADEDAAHAGPGTGMERPLFALSELRAALGLCRESLGEIIFDRRRAMAGRCAMIDRAKRALRAAERFAAKLPPAALAISAVCACGTGLAGCVSQDRLDREPLVVAEQLRAAGFAGRAVIVFGTGHVAGQAFNLTGASGFIEVQIDPGKLTTEAQRAQRGEQDERP